MQKKLYMIFIIVLLNTYNTLADTGLIISFDQANNPLATINTEVTELYSDLGITFPSAPTISTIGLWESQVIKQGEALDRGTRIVPLCEPLEIVFDPTLEVRTVAMTVLTRHLQYYEIEAVNDLDGPILVDKSIFSDIPSVGGILRGPPLFSKRITLRAQTEEPIITRVVANIPTGDDGICFDLMVIDDLEINGPTFAPVEVTGQKRCWDPDGSSLLVDNTCLDSELTELEGQDGYLQAGVPFPEPRFVDNRDGTVKDNMTGLIWLKNPSCLRSKMTWKEALIEVKKLRENDDAYKDCRVENNVNWRMPNIKELQSLVDWVRPLTDMI
jgi:hypothetical protein